MMKLFKILTLTLLITLITPFIGHSQNSSIIRITKTEIIVPEIIDFGVINNQEKFVKLIIKNERPNTVKICNITTPQGIVVSVKNKTLMPKSQTQLFIGISPVQITDTLVRDKITIETNLILPIVINLQAKIKK